jgi:uncharacterized membrane protein
MSIGRILNTAFGAIFGNLFVMLGIAFLFAGLPQGVISYFQRSVAQQLAAGSISLGQYFGIVILGSLLNMVFTVLAQGALVRATIASSHGERATFGECLSTACRRLLPLLGLGIISGLGVGFAAILLIVPGIILAIMWYVAAPVVIAEREGVFAALGRSAELTEGERWNVFVVLLILFALLVGLVILAAIVGGIAGATGMLSGGGNAMAFLVGGATMVSGTISAAIAGALPTAVYIELRGLKEGPETQGLDAVFA